MRYAFVPSLILFFVWMGLSPTLLADPPDFNGRYLSGEHNGERPIIFDTQSGQLWQRATAQPRSWKEALAYCQELSLAGRTDWRLPSATELATLVDLSQTEPAIDAKVFPFTVSAGYWTSSTYVASPDKAWVVDFSNGAMTSKAKEDAGSVKCVARWIPNGDGTVTDQKTGLLWEESPTDERGTYAQAIEYCRNLDASHGTWRLPLIQELKELAVGLEDDLGECGVQDPVCLMESCAHQGGCGPLGLFDGPGLQGCFWEPGVWKGRCRGYWSQSAHAEIDDANWYVDFANSIVTNYDNEYLHLPRCVREP